MKALPVATYLLVVQELIIPVNQVRRRLGIPEKQLNRCMLTKLHKNILETFTVQGYHPDSNIIHYLYLVK